MTKFYKPYPHTSFSQSLVVGALPFIGFYNPTYGAAAGAVGVVYNIL